MEVGQAAEDSGHRTDGRMTAATVMKNLTAYTVLLGREGKGAMGDGREFGNGVRGGQATVGDETLDILQGERVGSWGNEARVFTWAQEEEKGYDGHVGDGMHGGGVGGGSGSSNRVDQAWWDGLDPGRGWVQSSVGT